MNEKQLGMAWVGGGNWRKRWNREKSQMVKDWVKEKYYCATVRSHIRMKTREE